MDEYVDKTPKPGTLIPGKGALPWIEQFILKFRPPSRKLFNQKVPAASNIPTACLLEGEKIENDFSNLNLSAGLPVFVFFEPNELYKTTLNEILDYLKTRKIWEDYDICIFDRSLTWCFGISHEQRLILACKIKE